MEALVEERPTRGIADSVEERLFRAAYTRLGILGALAPAKLRP